jgi:hypothetical protein
MVIYYTRNSLHGFHIGTLKQTTEVSVKNSWYREQHRCTSTGQTRKYSYCSSQPTEEVVVCEEHHSKRSVRPGKQVFFKSTRFTRITQ